MVAQPPSCLPLAPLLDKAFTALTLHQVALAEQLAAEALRRASGCGDQPGQAQAHMTLTRAAALAAHPVHAYGHAQSAVLLFSTLGDVGRSSSAIFAASYAATPLGSLAEAVQLAEKGLALLEVREPRPSAGQAALDTAHGLNCLGVAQMWAGASDAAEASLSAAVWFAGESVQPPAQMHPLTNLCMLEVLRTATYSSLQPDRARVTALTEKVNALNVALGNHAPTGLQAGFENTLVVLVYFLRAMALALGPRPAGASSHLSTCTQALHRMPPRNWLHTLPHWVQVHLALAHNDRQGARQAASSMLLGATQAEHVPMQRVARSLVDKLRKEAPPRIH